MAGLDVSLCFSATDVEVKQHPLLPSMMAEAGGELAGA